MQAKKEEEKKRIKKVAFCIYTYNCWGQWLHSNEKELEKKIIINKTKKGHWHCTQVQERAKQKKKFWFASPYL